MKWTTIQEHKRVEWFGFINRFHQHHNMFRRLDRLVTVCTATGWIASLRSVHCDRLNRLITVCALRQAESPHYCLHCDGLNRLITVCALRQAGSPRYSLLCYLWVALQVFPVAVQCPHLFATPCLSLCSVFELRCLSQPSHDFHSVPQGGITRSCWERPLWVLKVCLQIPQIAFCPPP